MYTPRFLRARTPPFLIPAILFLVLCLVMLIYPAHAAAPPVMTGSFTLTTAINADGTLTPTLTWSTTPAAVGCVASGNAAWSGNKAASGTQTLPAFPKSSPQAYALVCNGATDSTALLTWTAPTQNTDGSTLTNLAGYRVHYGTAAAALTQTKDVPGASSTSTTITGLTVGDWFFGLRAYTTQGAESSLSTVTSKNIAGAAQWTQQTGVTVPRAPTLTVE